MVSHVPQPCLIGCVIEHTCLSCTLHTCHCHLLCFILASIMPTFVSHRPDLEEECPDQILFSPEQCDMNEVRLLVQRLADLLSQGNSFESTNVPGMYSYIQTSVPGRRYALTLQLMLKRFKKRKASSVSRSPKATRDSSHHQAAYSSDTQMSHTQGMSQQPISPVYDTHFPGHQDPNVARHGHHGQQHGQPHAGAQGHQPYNQYQANVDNIWRGFETTSNEQLPVWLSDQTLGGNSFSQNGIDAFLLPTDFLPPSTQIW